MSNLPKIISAYIPRMQREFTGIAIGTVIGVGIGLAFDNIVLGIGVGIAIAIAAGLIVRSSGSR